MIYSQSGLVVLYYVLRTVGRIAFPLYAFMVSEGCRYTKNIKKYLGLMAIFAVVSELPYNLAAGGSWQYAQGQNVYFTLFLGLLACYVVRLLEENGKNILWSVPVAALLCASAQVLETDYAWYGVLFVWLCAVTHKLPAKYRAPILIVGLLLIGRPWQIVQSGWSANYIFNSCQQFVGSLPALALLFAYNGRRGALHVHKYFFYAYYPAHLLLLGILARYVF